VRWAEKWYDVIESVDHLRYAAYLSMRRRSNKQVVIDRGDKMSMLMKGLKVVGLGVAIWGLGLLWPEVNLVLTLPVMIGVVLGLGAAALLAYVFDQRLDQRHDHDKAGQDPRLPIPAPLAR
jgi:hypothetical protein